MTGRTALILVDMQQDFLCHPALSPDATSLVTAVAALVARARAAEWRVIHVRTLVSADGSDQMPHWRDTEKPRCVDGSPGAAPPALLAARTDEPIIVKRFYSGFETGVLSDVLAASGVDRVVLAGVHTHACVRATALDAYAKGFSVVVATDAIGSYDRDHARLTLDWLDGRAARCVVSDTLFDTAAPHIARTPETWAHHDPCDWRVVLEEVVVSGAEEVEKQAERLAQNQRGLAAMPVSERAARLRVWRDHLRDREQQWIDLLVRDVAKPIVDARSEIAYGLGLVSQVVDSLIDQEDGADRMVRYRPHGVVGLITPWNNPFAIAIGKIAPTLGFGNAALWKPALQASALSKALMDSLADSGLGAFVGLVTGDARTGQAVAASGQIGALSFTGSTAVGRALAQSCGARLMPLQAELGGNNAAIVMAGCDLAPVAQDLAQAMFSFSGQRCTAIRRLIVDRSIADAFRDALIAAIELLPIGHPALETTRIGPVISQQRQVELYQRVAAAQGAGARVLTGGTPVDGGNAHGCWVAPMLVDRLAADSPLITEEQFGPVVVLLDAEDLEHAIEQHNAVAHGLLGAIYTPVPDVSAQFLAHAEAGLLLVNQARPAFSAAGPFFGWKASGFGPPEHGRWNRDAFARTQAIYRTGQEGLV